MKAGRQWENIDVWCELNESHLLIIEDKVGSGQHSNQLYRYKETAARWCKEHGRELVCIYIKTQSDSDTNLKAVAEQGFAVFSRRDLLSFLERYDLHNDIYCDFRDRLREIETSESQFDRKIIADWNTDDWRGFYRALEQKRPILNWYYVNNPSRGFLAAILNWYDLGSVCPYMQIEQGNLCFKIGEVYSDRADMRYRLHQLLMKNARDDLPIQRPSRFGSGTYMTVAVVPRERWLGEDDKLLDLERTVSRLNDYEAWLVETLRQADPVEFVARAAEPETPS